MSTIEIASKVAELRELKRLAEDLSAEIEAIQDSIKDHMAANEIDEITGNDFKITWKTVNSRRFDSKAFKAPTPSFTISIAPKPQQGDLPLHKKRPLT